jgi:hypothetical protein
MQSYLNSHPPHPVFRSTLVRHFFADRSRQRMDDAGQVISPDLVVHWADLGSTERPDALDRQIRTLSDGRC